MADKEQCKIILNKFNRAAGLSCNPETLEQIGGHQPSTIFPLEGTAERWRSRFFYHGRTDEGYIEQEQVVGLNLTPFQTEPQAGTAAEVEGGGGPGTCRAGGKAGLPRAGGKAAWMGSSKYVGFNLYTDTISILEPS